MTACAIARSESPRPAIGLHTSTCTHARTQSHMQHNHPHDITQGRSPPSNLNLERVRASKRPGSHIHSTCNLYLCNRDRNSASTLAPPQAKGSRVVALCQAAYPL